MEMGSAVATLTFWLAFLLIAYTYFGYPLLLWIQARLRAKPAVCADGRTFDVSIVMAARDEERNLPRKLDNLASLYYPRERLQIIVASDGSTDSTPTLLREHPDVIPVVLESAVGKASALNEAVKQATGEILIFMDVRQVVDPNAVRELVSCFADPTVGAVSGELLLHSSDHAASSEGLGVYWKLEKFVRKMEAISGSVVGVTGAIYAIRRELYPQIPAGTILDDVYVPMHIAAAGKRVIFQPRAIARDLIFIEKGKEFSRKVRTLTGNYQLLRLAPWLMTNKNPLRFRFFSHKLLRLFVPAMLIFMLIASGLAPGVLYRALFWLQVVFYAFAIVGITVPRSQRLKPVSVASTFVMLNLAAVMAFYNFIFGKNAVWA